MCQSQNLAFDLTIHLVDHQGEFLFTKGFIDDKVHLSSEPFPECEFRLQQKSYLLRGEDHRPIKNEAVVFGTEILIRHIFSNFYLSIELGQDGNEILKLRPDCNELCYFEILPQRTFEHKGDYVNFQSFFVIRHSLYKCYLGSNLLQTGQMRAKMERQLKTSKVKQSYRLNNPLDFAENAFHTENEANKSFCLENMKNFIEDQWVMREELVDELKKTDTKLKDTGLVGTREDQQIQPSEGIELPIKTGKCRRKSIRECAIEKHIHTMWRATKIQKTLHPFLEDNDYIYFISSNKNRGLMNISTKKERAKGEQEEYTEESFIEFTKNQGENQYICSAIFIVEIVDKESFYLKHLLTGKYFPFTPENTKNCLKLKPLLPFNCLENKLPPFHLIYKNNFYPTSIEEDASTCGFWLNKVNKLEINEILSLEEVPHQKWIPYLLKYLDSNRKRRQQILQEFKFIHFLIETLINSSQQSEDVYRLLFKMINNNQAGRKEVTEYLSSNILQSNKLFIIDILSEIFDNQMGFVQKYINPEQLGYILNDFILQDSYSVIYMRIFRLFCGHHTQPCQRNQNLVFNFFFHNDHKKKMMTQSVFNLRKRVQIPKHFKFWLKKEKGIILFENINECKPFVELSSETQDYIRQYYYLLGDCIKLNKENIEIFKLELGHIYSLQILLDILEAPSLQKLKGPILQLLNATYLEPQYRYKLYVFINDYESMCYNGGLIALHRNDKITRLLKYINNEIDFIRNICEQIDEKKILLKTLKKESVEIEQLLVQLQDTVQEEFKSTKFKHLLLMIKFSIENAYWENEDIVLNIVDIIGRFYSNKRSLSAESHSNYGQINEWKNYMESTIISIDIATLFIDIKINLALSHLITLPENKVDEKEINACARKIENNEQIRKYFSQFQVCDHQNSKLIKKSLVLSKKFYQLRHIISEKYTRAIDERIESRNLKDKIEVIKRTLHHIKNSNAISAETCKEYISHCLPGIRIQDLTPTEILRQGYTLNAVCRYRQSSHEFQVLAYRLGVLEMLKEDLWRYVNLRGKEKPQEQSHIYWKMVLVYVLIKDNKELRRSVSHWRRWLIGLIKEDEQRDGQIGILVIDILEEIYRNWRVLIVSDSEEILLICEEFVKLIGKDNGNYLGSNAQLNTKLNKLLNLLGIFLTVDGRKIKNNFQLVVNEIFDKQNIIKCIIKLRNMDNFEHVKNSLTHQDQNSQIHNNVLFKLLLYVLTDTLEQKPEKIGFMLPNLSHMINLILAVGRNNWNLTFRIYNAIQPKSIDEDYFTLLKVFWANLNSGIELILEYLKRYPEENPIEFKNSPEIRALLKHFSVMLKVTKMIVENVKFKNSKSPTTPIKCSQMKLQLVERLSLISNYVPRPLREKFFEIVASNETLMELGSEDVERLKLLNIKHFNIEEIKNFKISLLSLVQSKELQQEKHEFYVRWTKLQFGDFYAKFRNSTQQNIISSKFCIDEARQFIRSLIYINKSDILDTELKTFFISFLTSTFPSSDAADYSTLLKNHQDLLIEYGTAELITTILQEKYRENRGLFINLFELGNKLLESGSITSQIKFLSIFKRDHKNVIFQNITTIIESSLIGIRFYYQQQDGYQCEDEEAIRVERMQVCDILKRTFRFLQLLCENDNQDLKKYIYSQTNENGIVKYMSINFIEIALYLLLQVGSFSARQLDRQLFIPVEIRDNLLEVLFYIFDFLIEVCQYPAIKNQIYLCNTDFFNILKIVKTLSQLPKAQDKSINKSIFTIERKIVLLIRGLLEERNEEIINMVSKKIEEEDLKHLIVSSLNSIGVNSTIELENYLNTNEDKLIEEIENVVDVLIVSRVLGFGVLKLFSDNFQKILIEIDKKIREIEVDFKGQITKIYFCYRPIFDYLSENTRAFFINRSSVLESRNEKLRELINSRQIINQDIINRKSRQLIISENTISYLFTFSIILCFVLLFMQLFFYSINTSGIALDTLEDSLIHGLAVMQFLITTIYVSLWGINISSITKEKMKTKWKIQTVNKRSKLKYYWLLLKEIYLEQSSSLHGTLLFTLSFMSCWVDVRIYSLVLLYIFAKIETLSNILTAIRLTWAKLLVVCLLALAFTFVFGFLSINNYVRVLYENQSVDVDIGHIQSHCTSIITCIDSLYTQRIIGETPSREGQTSHYGRFFSDTIHWAFFDILFTNIIAAIIIDKFAELRNIKEKIENEQRNRCFICSAEKASIERKNEDFEEHVSKKHCLWDYFYYLYYLEKLKAYTEYTGIQYWIVRQVKENMIDWFPSDMALREDDDEKKLNSLFDLFVQRFQQDSLKEGREQSKI